MTGQTSSLQRNIMVTKLAGGFEKIFTGVWGLAEQVNSEIVWPHSKDFKLNLRKTTLKLAQSEGAHGRKINRHKLVNLI